ncbi:JAB domain-containing protein [Caproicibacterium sp. BJN0003]|uniref:JAB domain-containing protein n=1 Tax=Caproicibacterium sp. BJN0003 TaxID=2994078 RepID=UPI00225A05EB|nr:DNA repair protein RadC [Caproicibacterium sp. BJN0003]UZT83178.1 DNA repair protein RadC [Caproicibacterium sp. BJN0003]
MTGKTSPKNPHAGHRERMRERYRKEGIEGFAEHEVLEMMLFYCERCSDTNALSHRLLERFGSLSGVLDAPEQELRKVKGIGEVAITFFKQLPDFYRCYQISASKAPRIYNYAEAGRLFLNRFQGMKEECVQMMLLDSNQRMRWCGILTKGSVTASAIYMKPLVKMAVQYDAVFAILAHNHPSGAILPSKEDLQVTEAVRDALRTVEVTLADHIIVAGDQFLSLHDGGYFDRLFEVCPLGKVADSKESD